MLKFNKEDTKTEKFIVISLWIIALYFIIGSSLAIVTTMVAMQTNGITGSLGLLFVVLGIGLLLEKSWALQISAVLSFILILTTLSIFFAYLEGKSLDVDESIESMIILGISIFCYMVFTHKVAAQIYDVNFTLFRRVLSILYWTVGVGVLGFVFSFWYTEIYEEGVYRGFIVVYGTIFCIGLGFLIGLLKFFMFRKKE